VLFVAANNISSLSKAHAYDAFIVRIRSSQGNAGFIGISAQVPEGQPIQEHKSLIHK